MEPANRVAGLGQAEGEDGHAELARFALVVAASEGQKVVGG